MPPAMSGLVIVSVGTSRACHASPPTTLYAATPPPLRRCAPPRPLHRCCCTRGRRCAAARSMNSTAAAAAVGGLACDRKQAERDTDARGGELILELVVSRGCAGVKGCRSCDVKKKKWAPGTKPHTRRQSNTGQYEMILELNFCLFLFLSAGY